MPKKSKSKVYEPPLSLLYSQQFSLREAQAFVDFCVELTCHTRIIVEEVNIATSAKRISAFNRYAIVIQAGTPYQRWATLFWEIGRFLNVLNYTDFRGSFPSCKPTGLSIPPFLFSVLVTHDVTPCTDIHAASVVAKWRPIFAEARRAGKPITA